jgi:hypothetical protein
MPSLINVEATLQGAGRGHGHGHAAACQIDAVKVREVDGLVSQLLQEIEIPYTSLSKKVTLQLADMKQVLAADYREVPGLPEPSLLRELSLIVDTEIKKNPERWKDWDQPKNFSDLTRLFGPRQIEVRAEPYRKGAGLALRGFFCRANVGDKPKFVIFLNTAHHPGAVAATFGHEIGHYVYGSLVGENDEPMTAFMEGTFGAHLHEPHELFADALVALGAYAPEQIKLILGGDRLESSESILKRVNKLYQSLGPRIKLDLKKQRISTSWRVSYMTSMIHFFKLRCALLDTAQV